MKNKKEKGMTLIELIAAIAIFSIISVFLVSIITTALKFNIANKTTFDANSNSRAFYECIREDRVKPSRKYPANGNYVIYFNSQDEIKGKISSQFKDGATPTLSTLYSDIQSGASSNRYAILINIKKVERVNGSDTTKKSTYYELTTSSWDLQKGQHTQIDRKSVIAEE